MTMLDMEVIDLTSFVGDLNVRMQRELRIVNDHLRNVRPLSPTGKWTRRDPWLARMYGPIEWVDGCLQRHLGVDTNGYSILRADGETWKAHRLAWTIWRGPIPDEMTIDHLCERTTYILTSHLEVVSLSENSVRRHWRGGRCQNGHDVTDPRNVTTSGERREFHRCRPCWNTYMREHRRRQ